MYLIEFAAQLDDGKGLAQTVADVKDANKRGALHFAAREGQTEVCKPCQWLLLLCDQRTLQTNLIGPFFPGQVPFSLVKTMKCNWA